MTIIQAGHPQVTTVLVAVRAMTVATQVLVGVDIYLVVEQVAAVVVIAVAMTVDVAVQVQDAVVAVAVVAAEEVEINGIQYIS